MPIQDCCPFPDAIWKWIFVNKMYEFRLIFHWRLFLEIPSTVFQHWFRHQVGAKPLSEPLMGNLLTHICASWPQWVNQPKIWYIFSHYFTHIFRHRINCIKMRTVLRFKFHDKHIWSSLHGCIMFRKTNTPNLLKLWETAHLRSQFS